MSDDTILHRETPSQDAHTALLIHHRPDDFAGSEIDGLVAIEPQLENGYGLWQLAPGHTDGSITSAEMEMAFACNEIVASWNAWAPHGAEITIQLRVRLATGPWTRWYTMGIWSGARGEATRARSIDGQKDMHGRVDIDVLKLNALATAVQYRILIRRSPDGLSPTLRLVALVYADLREPLRGSPPPVAEGWARDLPVPTRSQMIEERAIRGHICSPTSVGMVLAYYGRDITTTEAYNNVRDTEAGIYGNWPLNTAYTATHDMKAYVARFHSIEQLKNEIARGHPVIISINFKPGQLENAPISKTNGHLLVVRGFTPDGDVIVNDPAAPDNASARRIYKAEQLTRVWIENAGGIVYLIQPLT